jgi:hypothetical protein
MKNITFSADERLIEEARQRALQEHTTLNEQFRLWLLEYSGRRARVERAMKTIDKIAHKGRLQGPFTRDEMNER